MNRSSFFQATAAASAAVAFFRAGPLALRALADDGTPIEVALIETLLPFGVKDFPTIASADIVDRIDSLYHIGEDPAFVAALESFDRVALFAKPTTQTIATELSSFASADIAMRISEDAVSLSKSGLDQNATFVSLNPTARTAYVRLWEHSAFNVRRRFYQSVRAIAFAALYSMPQSWQAIGYAGPLTPRPS